jgi:transcriptional regulator with XRE-family HTH domain
MTGPELKWLRVSARMSRRELAAATGKNFHTIKKYEVGQRSIPSSFALHVQLLASISALAIEA